MSYDDLISRATERAHGKGGGEKAALAVKPPSDPDKLLGYIGDLNRAITQAYDIADAMELRDYAQAVQWLTRKRNLDLDLRNRASETVIRSERRLGELLLEMEKNRGGNPNLLHDAKGSPMTYAQLGIEPTAASRWQTVARLPEEKFEKFIHDTNSSDYELTSGGILTYARNVLKNKPVTGPHLPDHTLAGDTARVLWDIVGALDRAGQVIVKVWFQ